MAEAEQVAEVAETAVATSDGVVSNDWKAELPDDLQEHQALQACKM